MARIIRQTDDARSREAQAYKGASTLVKCLTEILLNSYESYQRLEKKGIKAKPTITIHADSREESVEVIDHFEGLAESEEKGIAIGIGHVKPQTLNVLSREIPELQKKGFRFEFVSNLVY